MAEAFVWGPGGRRITATEAERNRKTADALRGRIKNPQTFWEGMQSAVGDIGGGLLDWQADEAQKAGREEVAQALQAAQSGGDPSAYMTVLGNEWASPSQSAVASALLNRGWSLEDRNADWDHDEELANRTRGWQLEDVAAERALEAPLRDAQLEGATLGNEANRFTLDQAREGYKSLVDPAERASHGIAPDDTTPWQVGPDGRLYDFGSGAGGGQTINVNTAGGQMDEFYKAGAKAQGEEFAGLAKAGTEAQAKVGRVNRLEQLLTAAPQGLEGGWKQFVGEFGIDNKGLDDIQSAQALINSLVPAQRPVGSGTMSDADLDLFKKSLPRIINQPGGNAIVIQTLRGIAVYEQQIGDIASKAINGDINPQTGKPYTPADARALMASVPNPLEMFRKDGGSASDVGTPPEGIDPAAWAEMTAEERKLWD